MEWELTEKEIVQTVEQVKVGTLVICPDCDRAIARAQARKMVDWGKELCHEHHPKPHSMVERFNCYECMAPFLSKMDYP